MARQPSFVCIAETCISGSRRRSEDTDDTDKKQITIFTALLGIAFFAPSRRFCSAQQVVDKMVATVNAGVKTDLITYSDLLWQLALQPNTPLDNPTSADLNRALRLLIDQRLILQEAEKIPTIVPTQKEISDARDELARNFPRTRVSAAAPASGDDE
jgi:hypothetical protein